LLFATAIAAPALAVERVYSIDTNQSSIAISGTVTSASLGNAAIEEQGAGSLSTSYSGIIRTDRSANTIQFLPGSEADASVNGTWRPLADGAGGMAPADYGARVPFNILATLYVAAREMVGDFSSGILPVTAGSFDLSAVALEFTGGSIAYRDEPFGLESGSRSLIGESGLLEGTGLLTSQMQAGGILETLTIPVNSSVTVTVSEASINLALSGQLVATALVPSSPPGDYNDNGFVDAADYTAWRDNEGTTNPLPNDPIGGTVGAAQYDLWRANFGPTPGSGAGAAALASSVGAVPEPSSSAATWILAALVAVCRRRNGLIGRKSG
jgi:hypothetical protein